MLTEKKIDALVQKHQDIRFTNPKGEGKRITFPGSDYNERNPYIGIKSVENRGAGTSGIRGLGMCSCIDTPWPLTHIHEETDEYIIACCDAGCATILAKKPPRKLKKVSKRKTKLVITSDGNLEPERKKTAEDNIME